MGGGGGGPALARRRPRPAWDVSHDAFGAINTKGDRSNDDDAVDPAPGAERADLNPGSREGRFAPGRGPGRWNGATRRPPDRTDAASLAASASPGSASVTA